MGESLATGSGAVQDDQDSAPKQPWKRTAARVRASATPTGQSTQEYQGTLMSVGGSKPGGYVFGSCSRSVSSFTASILAEAGKALKAQLRQSRSPVRIRTSRRTNDQRRGPLPCLFLPPLRS